MVSPDRPARCVAVPCHVVGFAFGCGQFSRIVSQLEGGGYDDRARSGTNKRPARDRAPTGNRENDGIVVSSVVDHTNKKLPARAAHRAWGSPITRPLIESRARATPRRARRRARRSQQTTAVVSLGAASRRPSSSTCCGGAEAEHTAQTTMGACGNMAWALSQDIVARSHSRLRRIERTSMSLALRSRPSARAPARRIRQPRHARRSCLLARCHEERRMRVRHPVDCFTVDDNCKSQRQ